MEEGGCQLLVGCGGRDRPGVVEVGVLTVEGLREKGVWWMRGRGGIWLGFVGDMGLGDVGSEGEQTGGGVGRRERGKIQLW